MVREMKEPALNDEQCKQLLEQVIALCGKMHPASRRPLVLEAKRLWGKLGIPGSPPAVVERRPLVLALRERARRRRARKRDALPLTLRALRK